MHTFPRTGLFVSAATRVWSDGQLPLRVPKLHPTHEPDDSTIHNESRAMLYTGDFMSARVFSDKEE